MNEESATPWHGDWRRRLQAKIDVLGFSDLEQYLAANPGLGYVQLAETLGEANISAAQIYGEQIQRAAKRGETRLAAKDCLARLLNEYLRRGWESGDISVVAWLPCTLLGPPRSKLMPKMIWKRRLD